jgi:hypothetical protein
MQLENRKERTDKAYEAAVAIASALISQTKLDESQAIDTAERIAWNLMTRFYGE